jgi:predicted Zn-dependent peptidase
MVLSLAGNLSSQTLDLLNENFGTLKKVIVSSPKKVNIKQNKSQVELIPKKLEQGHLILAYHTFGYSGKQRYALEVLMAILAGGMSSLLFIEIREKRGLAYAIEGGVHFFDDCGFAYIYGGFNKNKIEEALSAINNINEQAKKELFDVSTIKKAKEYLKGNLLMKLDGIRNTSTMLGQKKLLDPREIDHRVIMKNIDKITAQEINKVAQDIFRSERENLIILGPYKNKEKFAKILAQDKK